MHDIHWILNGTTNWQRDDGNFNVLPSTQIFTGLYSRYDLEHRYGIDRELLSSCENAMSKGLGLDQMAVFSGERISGNESKREATYRVKSRSEEGREYTVVLRNLPLPTDNFETRTECLKNIQLWCNCGFGMYEGKICSMPYEACKPWGMELDEYDRRMKINKPIGEAWCSHGFKPLQLSNVHPLFDLARYASVFPRAARLIIHEYEEKGKLKVKELDMVLNSLNRILGFQDVSSYFKNQKRREMELKKLERTVYSPPPLI